LKVLKASFGAKLTPESLRISGYLHPRLSVGIAEEQKKIFFFWIWALPKTLVKGHHRPFCSKPGPGLTRNFHSNLLNQRIAAG
jgi:hypothetical protein